MQQRIRLVQRLVKPSKQDKFSQISNAFAFGGGFKNGGISEEAMNLIRPIFRFDYMGAAEFEFGNVPKALAKIFDQREQMIHFEILIEPKNIGKNYQREYANEICPPFPDQSKPVYVFCHKDDRKEVEDFIRYEAKNKHTSQKYCLKEGTLLNLSLDPVDSRDGIQGWLELDNGFMFFTDKEMFEKTIALFA